MRLSRIFSVAVALVLAWTTFASAAAMLRTAPFPGDSFGPGAAACYVTNTGTIAGMVSATLYGMTGTSLETISPVSLAPHATTSTPYHDFSVDSPAHCLCVVPSTATYRCSFVYFDKDHPAVTVIGAP